EVPSPFSGKVVKLHGKAGDVIDTGAALVEIELDPKLPQRAEAEATGHHQAPKATAAKPATVQGTGTQAPDDAGKVIASDEGGEIPAGSQKPRADAGTVVGAMESSDRIVSEQAVTVGGVKAVPAVRALARKLGVDLSKVIPSGPGGVVTLNDVKDAASAGTARLDTPPVPSGGAAAAIPGASADRRPATSSTASRDAIQGAAQTPHFRPSPGAVA